MLIPPLGSPPPNSGTTKKGSTPTRKNPGSSNQSLYRQPLFDKRIRTLAWPMQGGLQSGLSNDFGGHELLRGVMVWDKPVAPYVGQAEVNFLFNPTTITASYSMDASDVASSLLYRVPGDTAQAAFAMNQSVNISLYYDRTFELWGAYDASNASVKENSSLGAYSPMDPTVYGVNVDILAFKQITGQLLTGGYRSATSTQGFTYTPGLAQQGVCTMIPTWLYLGPNSGLVYYGYVSDFTVTVTDWTQYMVPKRCVINFDFALMMPPGSEPNGPNFTDWMLLAEIEQDLGVNTQSPSGKGGR